MKDIVTEPRELTEEDLHLVAGGSNFDIQSFVQSVTQLPGGSLNQTASNGVSVVVTQH